MTRGAVVHLDALVLLQVIRHAQEALPDLCTGELLGLDRDSCTEVTHSFPGLPMGDGEDRGGGGPFVPRSDTRDPYKALLELSTTPGDQPGAAYAQARCAHLRDVNVDSLSVGMYVSSHLGAWLTETTLQALYERQSECDAAVCIVWGGRGGGVGGVPVRAYRLTEAFMALYEAKRFTLPALRAAGVTARDIVTALPIRLVGGGVARAALVSMGAARDGAGDPLFSVDPERLTFAPPAALAGTLENLVDTLDDMHQRHNTLQHHYRSAERARAAAAAQLARLRARNAEIVARGGEAIDEPAGLVAQARGGSEPPRLEALLLSAQAGAQCAGLNEFAGQAWARLFLAEKFLKA
eukprot:TRINITY_DN13401_c0_g1_i1.p2 TRINITY_DN13401_c0_g1~~TRINITY_DN13401_c0_g1_i1.p2  ORF type:complete len:352 (+),score=128.23 TRINITY_DN13401_c0_g1_i1:98-1153(+)